MRKRSFSLLLLVLLLTGCNQRPDPARWYGDYHFEKCFYMTPISSEMAPLKEFGEAVFYQLTENMLTITQTSDQAVTGHDEYEIQLEWTPISNEELEELRAFGVEIGPGAVRLMQATRRCRYRIYGVGEDLLLVRMYDTCTYDPFKPEEEFQAGLRYWSVYLLERDA